MGCLFFLVLAVVVERLWGFLTPKLGEMIDKHLFQVDG